MPHTPVAAWGLPGWVKDAASVVLEIPGKVADSVIMEFVKSMYSGLINMMQQFMTSFLDVSPGVDLNGDTMTWMTTATGPITFVLTTIGLMIAGMRAMYHARGQDIRTALEGLGRLVFVVTAGNVLISVLIPATDLGSKWIVSLADADFGKYEMPEPASLVSVLGGLLFLFSAISGLILFIQWGLMIIRAIMLPLLVAFWPVAEAANLAQGEVKFSKLTRWIIAFLAFKPVVAAIYTFSFKLMQGADGVVGALSGMATIVISIMAMPAILALVMPQSGGAGASVGGKETLTVAGVAAGAAVLLASGGAAAAGGAAGAGAGAAGSAAGAGGGLGSGGSAAGAGGGAGGAAGGGIGGGSSGGAAGGEQATDVGAGPTLDQSGWDSGSAESGGPAGGSAGGDTEQMPTLAGQGSSDQAGSAGEADAAGAPAGAGAGGSAAEDAGGVSETQAPSSSLDSGGAQAGAEASDTSGGDPGGEVLLGGDDSAVAGSAAGAAGSGAGRKRAAVADVLRIAEQAARRHPAVDEMFLDEKRLDS